MWLQIGVGTNGSSTFTILSPRQQLTPTPYSITARNLSGMLAANQLSGILPTGALSGTYSGVVNFNNAANTFKGNGSGLTGVTAVNVPTNHYLCVYSTTTQTVGSQFVTVAFDTVIAASGWTVGSGGYAFTAPASGLYLVQYQAQAHAIYPPITMSFRVVLNSSTEVYGSQAASTVESSGSGVGVVVAKAFLLQANAGDTVGLQFAASSNGSASLAPTGQGTLRPTANLTIIRVQ
jgi:hypothetical protein